MIRHFAAALALGLLLTTPALAEALKVVSENPAMPVGYTRLVVHSDRIGRDFAVTVNAPSATVFLPGQKLPAIYALDSGYGLAGPQGQLLSNTSAMEPAIVVAEHRLSAGPDELSEHRPGRAQQGDRPRVATYGGGERGVRGLPGGGPEAVHRTGEAEFPAEGPPGARRAQVRPRYCRFRDGLFAEFRNVLLPTSRRHASC